MNALGLGLLLVPAAFASPSFEQALGNQRVLVVLGDAAEPNFQEQEAILKEGSSSLRERDVVVFSETQARGPLHERLKQKKGFLLVLYGKDRGEKLRSAVPVSLTRLEGLIDSMPMRQQEKKERK